MSSINKFTADQMQALDCYFGPSRRNWNRIPSHSLVWKECLKLLKEQCQLHTKSSSPVSEIARKSLPLLQQKSAEDVRRFLLEHLIIGVHAIPERVQRFVSQMDSNQNRQYVCLVLSNPTASFYCDLHIKSATHPENMETFVKLDLLVEKTVAFSLSRKKIRRCEIFSDAVYGRCTSQISIPPHTYAVWKCIDMTIKRAFLFKIKEIRKRIAESREQERTRHLLRYAVLASALLAVLAFLRRCRR